MRLHYSPTVSQAGTDKQKRLVKQAVAEIIASLKDPANTDGYAWVSNWQDRYGRKGLGHMKSFIEKHPETFVIKPKRGKNAYSVALVAGSRSNKKSVC